MSPPNYGDDEVALGLGPNELVVEISDFPGWAWVGLVIRGPRGGLAWLNASEIMVFSDPPGLRHRVFLYGPIDEVPISEVWNGSSAMEMRVRLLMFGEPFLRLHSVESLVLSEDDRAVLWIYVEDSYLEKVRVTIRISLLVE